MEYYKQLNSNKFDKVMDKFSEHTLYQNWFKILLKHD